MSRADGTKRPSAARCRAVGRFGRALIARIGTTWWRILTAGAAVALYVVAVANRAYEVSTPGTLPFHELWRKTLAVLAFAFLGFLLHNARIRRLRGTPAAAIAIGLCSYAIEIGQIAIDGSRETFAQHGFDVASGVVGGALGAFVAGVLTERWSSAREREGVVIALSLLALAFSLTLTYGVHR